MKKHQNRSFAPNVEQIEQRLLLSAAPRFTVKDLGLASYVGGINSSGQVVGMAMHYGHDGQSLQFGVSGSDGSALMFPQDAIWPQSFHNPISISSSINDYGQVFGQVFDNGTENQTKCSSFIYSNGSFTFIDVSPPNYYGSYGAGGINNIGNATGSANGGTYKGHAFFYDGTMHDIGTLATFDGYQKWSVGYAINDSNAIAGISSFGANEEHAFYYDGTMHDLGTFGGTYFGGTYCVAFGINSSGQVVGDSLSTDGHYHAFISAPNGGALNDIGIPPGSIDSWASDINDNGNAVGGEEFSNYSTHGVFYDGEAFFDLNVLTPSNSGFTISEADGINNKDQISAIGVDSTGQQHALLLTPVPQTPTITWSNPADIVYGTPISSIQLNATADVPGTFSYSVAEGTVLHAGAAQTLTATFTPTDTNLYTTVTTTAFLNVLPAPLTVTANNVNKHFGMVVPPLTGTVTGLVNGDTDVPTYTTTATQGSWAGDYPIVPHLTDPNYNITLVNGILSIRW